MSRTTQSRKGFTLVELAVVIVIIGVLAAFGVPQFLKSVERSKAAEAFNYLSAVRAAQERYLAQNGVYATALTDLDIKQVAPKYFSGTGATSAPLTIAAVAVSSGTPTWYCSLGRLTDTSSYTYNVCFDENGYVPSGATSRSGDASTIPDTVNPMGN
jgi:type IV pilus assembly protein PilA